MYAREAKRHREQLVALLLQRWSFSCPPRHSSLPKGAGRRGLSCGQILDTRSEEGVTAVELSQFPASESRLRNQGAINVCSSRVYYSIGIS